MELDKKTVYNEIDTKMFENVIKVYGRGFKK